MKVPQTKFNIDAKLIIGKWKGEYYKVNRYSGEIDVIQTEVEFFKDFTGEGNLLENMYGYLAENNFRWFTFSDSVQIISKIQETYSNIPLLLFKIDEEEMVFHFGASCVLRRQ